VGIRHGSDVDGQPFFIWLIAGFIPWFYMSEMITQGANSIRKYRYLVKRIKFPVDTIPTFVSMSKMLVNLGLQLVMVVIYLIYGYHPTVYWLQFPLLILMSFAFFTAWGLFSAMLAAMSTDFNNLVKALVQPLFWMSGILYNVNEIPFDTIRSVMLYNPVTIIANGYRNMLVYEKWIWSSPVELRNYCLLLLIMVLLAIWAYRKLKKEIPDVL
jgi:teichoic acid transport system permease protein